MSAMRAAVAALELGGECLLWAGRVEPAHAATAKFAIIAVGGLGSEQTCATPGLRGSDNLRRGHIPASRTSSQRMKPLRFFVAGPQNGSAMRAQSHNARG